MLLASGVPQTSGKGLALLAWHPAPGGKLEALREAVVEELRAFLMPSLKLILTASLTHLLKLFISTFGLMLKSFLKFLLRALLKLLVKFKVFFEAFVEVSGMFLSLGVSARVRDVCKASPPPPCRLK